MKWIPKIASRNWDTCLCSNRQTILIITFFRKIKEVVCRITGYQAFLVTSEIYLNPVFSGSIKKLFSIDCVNIYLFSIFFSKDFSWWKKLFSLECQYFFQKFLLGRKGSSQYLYFLSIFFSRFCQVEKCGLPYISYIVIHYFLISNYLFRDNDADWNNITNYRPFFASNTFPIFLFII